MWLFMAPILIVIVILFVVNAWKNSKHHARIPKTHEDYDEIIIRKIHADFQKIGWTEWDESIHRASGQLERLKRAATDKTMNVVSLDIGSGTAVVEGSSGKSYVVSEHKCTCPDFHARGLPCKHMYFLAIELSGRKK